MAPPARQRRPGRRPVRGAQAQPLQRRAVAPIEGETKRIATATVRASQVVVATRTGNKADRAVAAFRITPVKPIGTRKINVMVYGPYGHGKTTFAGSSEAVPEMRDVLFVNAESGDMSLTGHRTLDVVDVNHYDQLARIFEYLTFHCMWRDENPPNIEKLLEYEKELKSDLIPITDQVDTNALTGEHVGTDPDRTWFTEQRYRAGKPLDEPFMYRTVILDSLSELHKYLVYKYTGVDIGTHPLDEELERMEEWQPAQELFRLLIRSFRDLPMNTIFVSAEALVEANRKKGIARTQMLPALAGKMAGAVAGFIDIVGYLEREITAGGETHRYLYLGAGYEGWMSKHRFENLPDLDFVEDPSLAKLFELARKDAENGTSPARPEATSSAVTPTRNAARTTATQRRSTAGPTGSSRRSRG